MRKCSILPARRFERALDADHANSGRMRRSVFFAACVAAAVATTAPASANSVLVGTWVLNGGEPRPSYRQTFTITRLAFGADGRVNLRWLPNPPMMISLLTRDQQRAAIAPEHQVLSYVDRGSAVEFAFRSDLESFPYEIRGSGADALLLLHMPARIGGMTKIYRRVH